MQLITLCLVCSIIAATLLLYTSNSTTKKKEPRKDHNDKYKIPPIFWDEYNWLQAKVNGMDIKDASNVQARINEFIYKYEQLVEFKVFNERVSILLTNYQKKVSLLLNNNHLKNGITTESI